MRSSRCAFLHSLKLYAVCEGFAKVDGRFGIGSWLGRPVMGLAKLPRAPVLQATRPATFVSKVGRGSALQAPGSAMWKCQCDARSRTGRTRASLLGKRLVDVANFEA